MIVLRGAPSGSGVTLSGGTVRIGPPGSASRWQGPVVQLNGQHLVASVSGPAGRKSAVFTLVIRGSVVTGTVTLRGGGRQ